MKKVSLLAAFFSAATVSGAMAEAPAASPATSPACCPKAFQGFHVGGNIGYGIGVAKDKRYESDAVTLDRKGDMGFRGVNGGVGTGYTHRFGNFALGLAFDANWASTKGKATDFLGGGDSLAHKVSLRNSLQLYARLGYVIQGQAMPFVGLGWDNSKWQVKTQEIDSGVTTTLDRGSKRLNALLWKAGVDFLATKHVVVGFEYTGTIAKALKTSFTDVALRAGTFKPQYNTFALTAKIVY